MAAQKFELFMGCMGNGTTVCNKAVYEHGDYKTYKERNFKSV